MTLAAAAFAIIAFVAAVGVAYLVFEVLAWIADREWFGG